MKLKIKLLRPFSDAAEKGNFDLQFNGITVLDLIKKLVNINPKLKKEFFTENGELTDYLCIFVNDKPVAALKGVETKLKNGDELLFFIPISGG
jgi:molybdopterin synthase sulfur carrier subunit